MPERKGTLVFTTIFEAPVLEDYYRNFSNFGHLQQTDVIVIPDRKTPASTYEKCRELNTRGLKAQCPTLEEQEAFLRRVGLEPSLIPYNSDNRRNVGYLMALESGSDFVLSIDDDNYCTDSQDAFAEHAVVCHGPGEYNVVSSSTGFYNICELLELERPVPVYARGYPYFARHRSEQPSKQMGQADVHMNAGLWILDPDIDAISWLVVNPKVRAFRGESVVLGRDTWSPINTQNTGLRRDAIAAYYFVKMGYPISGMAIDRYGDIFSGYFALACVKHLGGAVRVGTPVAEHRRNTHNYMKDAANEMACILLLEDLLPWLREVRLDGSTYVDAFESLSYALEEVVERMHGYIWSDVSRGYFHQVAYSMRAWLKACRTLQ